ncbi:M15 family metallopeptidase [Desulfobulbus alkaliphilus]|uniref:M15 family metallopeptidase n=1 Tax=Desulfobulbus alkaliphilus TaxID=869814 RepID=UPI00196637C9|nr:M15 family metallopeptidase [Desulfobulbus alkaliphilus]MBM9537484.1 M15 family metallopeptidase [Desulfobulbus alkaliphilus]
MLIDGIVYPIPPPWAGNKIEPSGNVVEKLRKIPRELTHDRTEIYLHEKAVAPLKAMTSAAAEEGVALEVHSGYRSARYQRTIIKQLMARGRTFDDIIRYVAPPGYSEHMLGTVVDFYPSNWTFVDTEAYQWLRLHAGEYGFIETYHQNNRTGHPWEPWHWKYEPPPGVPVLFSDAPMKTGRTESEPPGSSFSAQPSTPNKTSIDYEENDR